MKPLDHFAEPFPPTGTMAAEGVLNQLGRPRMGPLEVLVREAVQNCWDARADGSPQVRVSFSLIELSEEQQRVLADTVFRTLPEGQKEVPLRSARRLLLISDRGTRGLGGVLRANLEGGGDAMDFVDFLRNVGQPPDTAHGGGTYGYGKVALYLASRVRTILVDTRCHHDGRLQRRLLCSRLGEQFTHEGVRYTGRHWWGRLAEDGILDPALDEEAEAFAGVLGFPGFAGPERGSTIALLDPDFGELQDREAMTVVAEAIAWNFWPKMTSISGLPPMTFQVKCCNDEVDIPDLETHPVLSAFRRAFVQLKEVAAGGSHVDGDAARTLTIRSEKPSQDLGVLSLVKFPNLATQGSGSPGDDEANGGGSRPGLDGRIRHTALLRFPELVVKYQEGPETPTPAVDYAGVFLADPDLDRVFAASEPPTHDDWVPDGLPERRHRTFVRVAARRIADAMKSFSGAAATSPGPVSSGSSLGALAGRMAGLLPGVEGPGPGEGPAGAPSGGGGGRSGRVPRPVVELGGQPVLELIDGRPSITVRGHITIPSGVGAARVRGTALVLLESGKPEGEAPAGAELPRLIRWLDGDDRIVGSDETILFEGEGEHRFAVSATVPGDVAVAIDVTCVSGAEDG